MPFDKLFCNCLFIEAEFSTTNNTNKTSFTPGKWEMFAGCDFMDCTIPAKGYIFSGHIHPAISMRGMANQSLHFPCFYFGAQYAVLPAFSRFSGTHTIKPKRGESVYALLPPNLLKGELGGILKV